MLRVTWEWIGMYESALDVANTVAVSDGVPHDLLAPEGEYERWATAAAKSPALSADEAAALIAAKPHILELRRPLRRVIAATAAGERLPRVAVADLNRASRAAPAWVELGDGGELRERAAGGAVERLVANYARSAMAVAAEGPARLRVCGAPSCGMYYRPTRERQRWCSTQCGTRARVARHYRAHRPRPAIR